MCVRAVAERVRTCLLCIRQRCTTMFRDSLLKLNFLCVFMTSLADDLNVATVSMPVLHVCKAVHAMRRE